MSVHAQHTDFNSRNERRANGKRERTSVDLFLENIPDELKDRPQWVNFRLGRKKANGKREKMPLNPRDGTAASIDDPATWGTIEEVAAAYLRGVGHAIAYALSADDPYFCVDKDGCRDPETGQLTPEAQDLLERLNTYSDVSISGTGAHAIGKGTLPSAVATDDLEMYDRRRFLITTGQHIGGTPTTIEERQAEALELWQRHHRNGAYKNGSTKTEKDPRTDAERVAILAELTDALTVIPADTTYKEWIDIGMGIHSVDSGEDGFAVWHDWSQTGGAKYRGRADCHKHWRSFTRDGGITHKSIFALAIERGWKSTEPRADGFAADGREDVREKRRTDTGLAERFADQHRTVVRWVKPWKSWVVYDGTRWKRDDTDAAQRYMKQTVKALYGEAREAADADERKAVAKFAMQSEAEKNRRAALTLAKSEDGLPALPDQFDTDPWLLNCRNGTLDLRTGTLKPHDQNDYLTRMIPIVYDPAATCPRWEAFLLAVMNDDAAVIDFLQEAVGYSLTGSIQEQCVFLLYGKGANGKSTFLTVLDALLGEYGATAEFSTFLHQERPGVRHDLAALCGARLVMALEMEEGKRLSESILKGMTGGEKLTARFLNQEFFTFMPQFKVWLAANHKPVIRGTDHAIWRRIRLIPFTRTFSETEADPDIGKKLLTELPGILAWAVRGCRAWQKHTRLRTPEPVKKATQEYRDESDVMKAFLNDCCELRADLEEETSRLYSAYVHWCQRCGEGKPMTKTKFGLELKEQGFTSEQRSRGRRMWVGLCLSPDAGEADA
jgi:putative DNA primase/helicase